MDRGLSDDPLDGAVCGVNRDVLALRDRRVAAADAARSNEAVVIDRADDKADFIGMSRQDDLGCVGIALVDGDGVPVRVRPHVVRELVDVVQPDALTASFVP